jgi:hypothetical protein
MMKRHITLDVCQVEFHEGTQTLWVHAPDGTTTLRIKCTGKIVVDDHCVSPVAHGDMVVQGDIHICLPHVEGSP